MVRLLKSDRPRPRDYFSRREQWRLLLLVAGLGLVIFLMREVRRPENVAKVTRLFAPPGAPVATTKGRTSVPAITAPTPARNVSRSSELSTDQLTTIRDNTYFRTAEKDAWFKLIELLMFTPENELAAKSVGDVGYVQLSQQPDAYRGKVVTVRGTVRQVTEEKPAANDLGIASYYRLVLEPTGGDIWPIFVYCLTLPADFPRGAGMAVDIMATGFFFKNLSYEWRGGLGLAPIVLVNDVQRIDSAAANAPSTSVQLPVVPDARKESGDADKIAIDTQTAELAEVLSLAGWPPDRLAKFIDDQPLAPNQIGELAPLLWRVQSFDAADIAGWAERDVSAADVAAKPGDFRGKFLRFNGRVRRVEPRPLSAAESQRLEMPRYFECELALVRSAGSVTILTPRVPLEWLKKESLDAPATVTGLFIKRLPPAASGSPNLLVVAEQVVGKTFGRSVLATLGMDAGLLDGIRNHVGIRAAEREAFYAMLAAVGRVDANQLIRFADENLPFVASSWATEIESDGPSRRALADEVARLADEGRYSVAPLFLDADQQIGQLVVVDGVARRIVRVDASGSAGDGAGNEVARQLGINHYYEMEVYTEDSQNRPLVFCVRDLPPGMPTGGDVREPVRVAGFFFKSWRYRTRDAGQRRADAGKVDALGKLSVAPLVVGRGPVRLEVDQGGGRTAELIGGGLFLAALAGIWAVAWWFARGDRQFRARTPAAAFSLPPGESLDELHVPVAETPMKLVGRSVADTRNSP